MADLRKQLEKLEQEIRLKRAMVELPEGINLQNIFDLEIKEDRERYKQLQKWLEKYPEYDEKILVILMKGIKKMMG